MILDLCIKMENSRKSRLRVSLRNTPKASSKFIEMSITGGEKEEEEGAGGIILRGKEGRPECFCSDFS